MKTLREWDTLKNEIGTRLTEARVAAGLSKGQTDILLGLNGQTDCWEGGVESLPSEFLAELCDLYKVDPRWILGLIDESHVDPEFKAKLAPLKSQDREKLIRHMAMIGRVMD